MIRCYNCGADIGENEVECPYCHASQHENAEKKYMNDLYSMNDTMDQMDDNAIRTELKTTLKHSIIMAAIFAVCIVSGSLIGVAKYKSYHDNSKERREIIESYEWYDNNIDKLDEMYNAGNFAQIDDFLSSEDIYKNGKAVKYWKHYAIVRLYSYYYRYILNYMDDDSSYYYNYESSYTSTYRYCVDFVSERNKCLTGNNNVYSYYSLTDRDVVIAGEWVNKVESFVHDNLKVTKEEFANDVKNYDSYSYDDLKQRALVYYDRMK